MNADKYKRVKLACYMTNVAMSVVTTISPILFLTFRVNYGISYSLIGLLVLINFCTQLFIDLMLSFFMDKFNIEKSVKLTPLLCFLGLLIFGMWPLIFPNYAYIGLIIGTVVFSASGGFSEVLISPVIAAIPSKEPDREMSKLHSTYAWGVVFVIIVSTLYLMIFGSDNWYYLVFLLMLVPLTASLLFSKSEFPKMTSGEKNAFSIKLLTDKKMALCILLIFLGGASECTMAQWSSGYIEKALGIPKALGDIFGTAMFSVMLGLGRTLYSKIGKNIKRVLLLGFSGAFLCYIISAVSSNAFMALIACVVTGFCVSMLWPGSLITVSEFHPEGGVIMYALMAAGGDFGASVGPQLVGIITDVSMKNPYILKLASAFNFMSEQIGMKIGMLFGGVFPLLAIPLCFYLFKKKGE